MDDRATNLIYALFTWFGRAGCIRFVVTSFLLLLLAAPLILWNVSEAVQNIVTPIIGWGLLMQFIKRGHDFGAPAWVSVIVAFASAIIIIPVLAWILMPGDSTHNKYGLRGTLS